VNFSAIGVKRAPGPWAALPAPAPVETEIKMATAVIDDDADFAEGALVIFQELAVGVVERLGEDFRFRVVFRDAEVYESRGGREEFAKRVPAEEIMAWCELQPAVYYCLGLAKNPVLIRQLRPVLVTARLRYGLCGAPSVRAFAEFEYQTPTSWSRPQRVVGKAEVLTGGENPRFIVTDLTNQSFDGDMDRARFTPTRRHEALYCARGEMENVLKHPVLDLQADKLSTHFLASNQLRLWLAGFAYQLLKRQRTLGCHGTELARATVSMPQVCIQLSSTYPRLDLFCLCHARLGRLAPANG